MKNIYNERVDTIMKKKDKIQLAVIWGLVFFLVLASWIALTIYMNTPAHAAAETYPTETSSHQGRCPAGSYEIGSKNEEPICKLEPTGCPWGDSVPMDKCAPPPDIECNADWSYCKPKSANTSAPVTPKPETRDEHQPTRQNVITVPKNANNGAIEAAPHHDEQSDVNETVENVDIDEPNVNESADRASNEPKQDNAAQMGGAALGIGSIIAGIGAVIRRKFLN